MQTVCCPYEDVPQGLKPKPSGLSGTTEEVAEKGSLRGLALLISRISAPKSKLACADSLELAASRHTTPRGLHRRNQFGHAQ